MRDRSLKMFVVTLALAVGAALVGSYCGVEEAASAIGGFVLGVSWGVSKEENVWRR